MNATVVLVTSSFPTAGDGREAAGVFARDLALALAEHVQVRVVAPGPARTRERVGERLDVFRFAAPARALSSLNPLDPRDWWWLVRVVLGGRAATLEAARDGARAIVALWALPSGWWAHAAARRYSVPWLVWALGSDIWSLGRVPVVRGVLARVLRAATHVYADGLQLADDAARIGGRPVSFLPSTRDIGPAPDKPLRAGPPYRLAFIGRWHPNKGTDLMLDALARLDAAAWSRIESVAIYGGGPLEDVVRAGVARLQRDGRPVTLGGYVDTARAREIFVASDYVLIPSRIESIPVVFSDAMKTRCPVVAMPVGDLPRLVAEHGVGVVAAEVHVDAYARALSEALAHPPAAAAAGLDAAADAFSLERRIVPELLERAGARAGSS